MQEFPISFGDWLRERRKFLDLTQRELAERACCSIFALRKIESGERRPSKQLAGMLAGALEVPGEDTLTFIRVARGELNLERLLPPAPKFVKEIRSESEPVISSLPLPLTSLLGREAELAALERLFKKPQCRLLTLTGMGGIGKTRLAIEFASCQRDNFPSGVYYVPLGSINSPELIVPAIAEVLELTFSGPMEPKDQLVNYLASEMKQPMLLILDNFEHLILPPSNAVDIVSDLLQRISNLNILVTSRERLNLHGEWMYELSGLLVPLVEYIHKLEDYSSVALFVQCARRIQSDFKITDIEKPAIVRICNSLEGIPLAIELAGAWVGLLSCEEIAGEIESNIDFLATTMRDIPERHRSLRASFDHSWRLLSDVERGVLCSLAVFHGGFDRPAAEKIGGATLHDLASLVSKSLVHRNNDGRYDLHEAIRQFALSYLDQDPFQCIEARDLHSEYYLNFIAERERALKSSLQQNAMRELIVEMDNLRAAWSRAIQLEGFSLLGKSVRAFGWFFEVGGLIQEGIDHFETLVKALKTKSEVNEWQWVLGQALTQQGMLYFRKGRFDRAQALLEGSLSVLRPLAKPDLLIDSLIYLGIILHLDGDIKQARSLQEEGLLYARSARDTWFVAYAIYNLGFISGLEGQYHKGRKRMQAGICIWRKLGDPHSIALGLNYLSPTLVNLGDFDEAEINLRESLSLCKRSRNRWGMGTAYRYLGLVKMSEGDLTEAKDLFHKSLETFGDYIVGWDIARTTTYLGDATLKSGDLAEACEIYLDALQIARDIDSNTLMLDALVGLAQIDVCSGNFERAWEVASLVRKNTSSFHETKDRAAKIMLEVENFLDKYHFQAIKNKALKHNLQEIMQIYL